MKEEEGPLMYPEPPEGWKGAVRSNKRQSPIDIPPDYDIETIVKDNGKFCKINSMEYSLINSAKVAFDHCHKWTTKELEVGKLNIFLNGKNYTYKLHSIHFHLYSEHRIQNRQFPMEMHMVHKNVDKTDKENENLVIGVIFDYQDGHDNEFLNAMKLSTEKDIEGANINSIISKDDPYYFYQGSLTTIPCTENVNWIVFKNIRNLSYRQFCDMREWIRNSNPRFYDNGYGNARGPKALNGRKVYLENSK